MADREVIRTTVNGRPVEIRLRHRRIRDPNRQVHRLTNWEAWDQGKCIARGSHGEPAGSAFDLAEIKEMVAVSMSMYNEGRGRGYG